MTTTNTVPMHANATRPAPLYLNPTGQTIEEQIEMLTKMIDADNWERRTEPYARVITITPKLAQYIVDNIEEKNRKRSAVRVKQYSRAVVDGWSLTGQTIIFSRCGKLLDGGHRLSAIILSGKAIRTMAVFGVHYEAFSFLDIGRKRTPANTLEVLGVAHATTKAGAMRWAYIMTLGKCGPVLDTMPRTVTDRGWVPLNEDIRKMWDERFKDDAVFEWAVQLAVNTGRALGRVVDKNTLAALFFIWASSGNHTAMRKVEDFAKSMTDTKKRAFSTGAKLVKKLHEKLHAADGRLHEIVRVVLTARALEAHMKGDKPVFSGVDSESTPPTLPTVGTERIKATRLL
jgi:hypothetical protein